MIEDKPVLQLTDIIELLDEIIENFKNPLEEKSITLHKYLSPLPYILIDKYQIKKAIHTFIQDLIKTTKSGEKIEIITEKEGQFIKISIRKNTFNNFEHPDLSLLRKIVEQHGGHFNSKKEQQAIVFYIYLPLP